VEIGFIDFQGLWEGRKTAPSFSGLSINRHFHGLPRSPRTLRLIFYTTVSEVIDYQRVAVLETA
jgi:hypothetical protein